MKILYTILGVIVIGGAFFVFLTQKTVAPSGSSTAPANDQVVHTATGFSPARLEIAKGTTVTFINESQAKMWVASDTHPVHTDYPEFDQKEGVMPMATYQFTFDRTGTWKYHNHLNPVHVGTIIVK